MFKFLVIISLVSVVFNLNNERVFVDGADKSSEGNNVLRGAHFKVLAFQVNIEYIVKNNSIIIKLSLNNRRSIRPLCMP